MGTRFIGEIPRILQSSHIITLKLPPQPSYLTQPLDAGCFSVLKRAFGRQIAAFIKAHISHVTEHKRLKRLMNGR
jgi:hypothetical protein